MSVYVDEAIWGWEGLRWAHLLADDEHELHRFAVELGLHRISYQGPPKTANAHYDITGFERKRALALGAIACDRNEIVLVLRKLKQPRARA
jgi:hypothetical protein